MGPHRVGALGRRTQYEAVVGRAQATGLQDRGVGVERGTVPHVGRQQVRQGRGAGPPQPVRMVPRGHYAYQIVWTDGHDTGIYTLELLRQVGEPAPPA